MADLTLLDRLKSGKNSVKLVKWPGTEEQIAFKVLSEQERQEALLDTERYFKSQKIDINMMTSSEYENENATQILFRAIKDPAALEATKFTTTILEFRQLLTRDIKGILLSEYLGFESEISPSPDNLSNEEFDRIVASVKKNATETIGKLTSIAMLKKLIITLVSQQST